MDLNKARTLMSGLSGLFVGQLSDEEREAFDVLERNGEASVSYQGASGFLGLAKVKINLFCSKS